MLFQHVCVIQIIQQVKYVIKIVGIVHAQTLSFLFLTEHVVDVKEDMEIFLIVKVSFLLFNQNTTIALLEIKT